VKGIESVEQEGGTVSAVFGNKIFRNIVLSLAATYGLYIISSLLAFQPWHLCEWPRVTGRWTVWLTRDSHEFHTIPLGEPHLLFCDLAFRLRYQLAPSYINVMK
jgi:hypothetical protein